MPKTETNKAVRWMLRYLAQVRADQKRGLCCSVPLGASPDLLLREATTRGLRRSPKDYTTGESVYFWLPPPASPVGEKIRQCLLSDFAEWVTYTRAGRRWVSRQYTKSAAYRAALLRLRRNLAARGREELPG